MPMVPFGLVIGRRSSRLTLALTSSGSAPQGRHDQSWPAEQAERPGGGQDDGRPEQRRLVAEQGIGHDLTEPEEVDAPDHSATMEPRKQ